MKEALEKAAADLSFQFFLARLFGQFIRKESDTYIVEGYAWRDHLYFTKSEERPKRPESGQSA